MKKVREKPIYVGSTPIWYPEVNLNKQVQIELWLGMQLSFPDTQLIPITQITKQKKVEYIV